MSNCATFVVPPERKFWDHAPVGNPQDCWEWSGRLNDRGYGYFCISGKQVYAHRYSHELINAPIPGGLFVCHKCDNPRCVNPNHLYAGTNADNMRDKVARGRHHRQRVTHCIRGHEFTPENTYRVGNRRQCRKCRHNATISYRQRVAALVSAAGQL